MMSNFSRHEPVIMDSTAVMTYKTCPRKYFYRIVLGFVPPIKYSYFAFGSAYHLFREVIEKEWMKGERDIKSIVLKGIEAASDYCDKHLVTPLEGKWSFQTKDRLISSCLTASKWWKDEKDAGFIKVLASEQPFRLILPSNVQPEGIIIAGRADQIISVQGRIWGRDFKTTSQAGGKGGGLSPFYSNTLEPNDQFTRYTYAETILQFGELLDNPRSRVQGQYVEVLINNATSGPKIEALTTQRSKTQLEVWMTEHDEWMKFMAISRESDIWPMNEKSCNFCEYRKVCTMSNVTTQMTVLNNEYEVEPWNCEAHAD